MEIDHQGYGSSFNTLYYDEPYIIKKAKNDYGMQKIQYEMDFYSFLQSTGIDFPIPDFIFYEKDGYGMTYYKDWKPLSLYSQGNERDFDFLLAKVYLSLNSLHSSFVKLIPKATVRSDLHIELVDKLQKRRAEINTLVQEYSFIRSVNGLPLESFDTLLEFFEKEIEKYCQSKTVFHYTPIHGDCQFNNILVSPMQREVLFLDPRGYFGKTAIYGLKEYDYAKILFSLTGYDRFDKMTVDALDISGSNITVNLDVSALQKFDFVAVLTASIWMGNAHSFQKTPKKALYSYFYGLYFATFVYNSCKSGTK